MRSRPDVARSRPGSGERSLRRALEVLRQEGPRSLWFKFLGETVYRRMDLIERELDAQAGPPADTRGLEFGLLAATDVDEFLAFRDYAGRDLVLERLTRGERCFLLRDRGRIVHCCWTATGRSHIDYLGCDIRLANGAVYVYEAYTAPEARGRSASSLRSSLMEQHYAEHGYHRLVAVIWPENRPVYRSMEKAGYRVTGRIGFRGPGRWRRHFFRYRGGNAPLALVGGPGASGTGQPDWDRVPGRLEPGRHYLDPFLANLKRRENLRLAREWGGLEPAGRLLKTDAFEEAVGDDAFLEALEGDVSQVVAIDVSAAVASRAAERYRGRGLRFLAADTRQLPFADAVFTTVVSPSTLDHFPDPADLGVSLRELLRVLRPGGRLVITLDNRQNVFDPLLRLAHRLGLVPFYMGRSYRVGELRRELEQAGFEVRATTAILHNPRLVAVGAMRLVRWLRWKPLVRGAERLFLAAQRLEHSRLCYYSGSFVAAQAVRPPPTAR